jgi:hypothetical protein
MTDRPEESSAETPMQRALRLKKAALNARSGPPAGGRFQRAQIAGIPAGMSKPQMRK